MEKQTKKENKKKAENTKKKMETSATETAKAVRMALSVSAESETVKKIFPESVLLAMAASKTNSGKFQTAVDSMDAIRSHAIRYGIRVDWSGQGGRLRFDKVDGQGRPCGRLGRISSQGGILLLKGSSRVKVSIGLVPATE